MTTTIDWAPTSVAAILAMYDKSVGLAYEVGRAFVLEGLPTEPNPFTSNPSLAAAYERGVRAMPEEA
jgi:hypothetical protein